ncbi:MAG: SRPBCC family protein [Actinomycetota bacterium]|nr:SRPBCC family protein [Actinomycetota bacterium]
MAEQTEGEIEIDATPEEVLEVITDFDAYPQWAQGVKKTEVKNTDSQGRPSEVFMEVGQMGFNASYTLAYKYKAKNGGLSWTSKDASGAVKSLKGEYVLDETDGGTHVTYRMTVEPAVKLPGMMRKQAERMVVNTALGGLKKRVEGR